MKKQLYLVTVFFAVMIAIGIVNLANAVEDKAKKTIYILFDSGVNKTLEARQAKAQMQLSDWMEDDLVRVFGRYEKFGYQVKLIEKRNDFKPRPNNYLLNVRILEYRPGSKAARMVVGFGAGGVSLKIHYELSEGKKAILSNDDGVFSGREWMNATRKLNEKIAKAVTEKLGKG